MDRHATTPLAGRTALAQRAGSADLGGKMHDATRLERHHHLVGALHHVLLPIQLKGRFGKASPIAYWPGLAIHLYVRRTLPDPRATEVGPIDVQFAHSDLLAGQILSDWLSHARFWNIGCCHAHSADQPRVQVL